MYHRGSGSVSVWLESPAVLMKWVSWRRRALTCSSSVFFCLLLSSCSRQMVSCCIVSQIKTSSCPLCPVQIHAHIVRYSTTACSTPPPKPHFLRLLQNCGSRGHTPEESYLTLELNPNFHPKFTVHCLPSSKDILKFMNLKVLSSCSRHKKVCILTHWHRQCASPMKHQIPNVHIGMLVVRMHLCDCLALTLFLVSLVSLFLVDSALQEGGFNPSWIAESPNQLLEAQVHRTSGWDLGGQCVGSSKTYSHP